MSLDLNVAAFLPAGAWCTIRRLMDEAEPNLKVTDRRHFTAEGELREPDPSMAEETESKPAADSRPETLETPEESTGPAESAAVTFSSFVVSLATQAADFLGGEGKNLGAARQVISALEMLKDKTEGRRTDDETRIIEAILFDLRLAFVGSAKGQQS